LALENLLNENPETPEFYVKFDWFLKWNLMMIELTENRQRLNQGRGNVSVEKPIDMDDDTYTKAMNNYNFGFLYDYRAILKILMLEFEKLEAERKDD